MSLPANPDVFLIQISKGATTSSELQGLLCPQGKTSVSWLSMVIRWPGKGGLFYTRPEDPVTLGTLPGLYSVPSGAVSYFPQLQESCAGTLMT